MLLTPGTRLGPYEVLSPLPMSSGGLGQPSWRAGADGERFYVFMPPRSTNVARLEVVTDFMKLVGGK